MKHLLIIIILAIAIPLRVDAQRPDGRSGDVAAPIAEEGQTPVHITSSGEIIGMFEHPDVIITAPRPNKKELRQGRRRLAKFNRLQWNVHKTFPYAVGIAELLEVVQAELETLPKKRDKRQFINEKEKELFGEYEDDLRKMSRKQGLILIKLVHRQTGDNAFNLIKDLKTGAAAVFWQGIGRIFGMNLKDEYDVEAEEMIEQIVTELENDGYNIVYKQYGFYFSAKKPTASNGS